MFAVRAFQFLLTSVAVTGGYSWVWEPPRGVDVSSRGVNGIDGLDWVKKTAASLLEAAVKTFA